MMMLTLVLRRMTTMRKMIVMLRMLMLKGKLSR